MHMSRIHIQIVLWEKVLFYFFARLSISMIDVFISLVLTKEIGEKFPQNNFVQLMTKVVERR